MKYLFLFLLLLPFAFSADPSIIDFNYTHPTIYGNQIDFNVFIDANNSSGKINFMDKGTIIEQKNFINTTTIIAFSKTFTELGDRNITFQLTDIADENNNVFNDSKTKIITIQKGTDFKMLALNITPETYLAGTTLQLEASAQNIGDADFNGDVNVSFSYDNAIFISKKISGLRVNEAKTAIASFTLPQNFSGTHTLSATINNNSLVKEFDITNNTQTKTINETSMPNLRIASITHDVNLMKGKSGQFHFTIENNGGTNVGDILVRIYRSAIDPETQIYETTISSLNAHATQQIDFAYFFIRDGNESFVAYVDPLNNVAENNEGDNTATISFEVKPNELQIDMLQYLVNIEKLEGELTSCKSDLFKGNLERDTALESVASMTKERDSCISNLGVCNTNNATFLSNWSEIRDKNYAELESYYFSELIIKDNEIEATKETYENKLTQKQEETNIVVGILIMLIIFLVGIKLLGLIEKRKMRLIK